MYITCTKIRFKVRKCILKSVILRKRYTYKKQSYILKNIIEFKNIKNSKSTLIIKQTK